MESLANRIAFVTGGSRGIGAAIARRLALDGADVAFSYATRTEAADSVVSDIQRMDRRALAFRCDSADTEAIRSAIKTTADKFGGIDILVNNVGVFAGAALPIEETTSETLDTFIDVNIRGTLTYIQAVIPHIRKGGRIISIGSCLSVRTGRPGRTLYAMCKSAMGGLTKGLARDLAAHDVTVNLISPGPIDTDMNPAGGAHASSQIGNIALGRYGMPNEIAAVAAFLASAEAAFITGADIAVDGGINA